MEDDPPRNKCTAMFFGLLGGIYGQLQSKLTGRPNTDHFDQLDHQGIRSHGGAEELPDYQ